MATANVKKVGSASGTPGANGSPESPGSTGSGGRAAGVPRFEPDVFGKYYLLQRIGIGGMAEVIRAKTVGAGGFQKELVIKRVLPRFAKDATFVRMFVNEAKITVGLTHQNIAQILELGEIDGVYFMAMELIEGVDLATMAPLFRDESSTLTSDDAVWLTIEILKGLDHAHRRCDSVGNPLGIVHCDISTDNVMVNFDAAVKILDFGIARVATSLSNRREGIVMGKVNFLSPEQALGKDVDHRADVYSTGVLLYNLVTGEFPYGRFQKLDDLAPLVSRKAEYIPAKKWDPHVPDELDQIIRKAVALDARRRYPDARSLLMDLEEVLYPTPHSAIAEHVRAKLSMGFPEKKERLARLRSNDGTVMKILARRVEGAPRDATGATGEHVLLAPAAETTQPQREAQSAGATPKRRRIEMPWWYVSLPQVVLALIATLLLSGIVDQVRSRFFVRGVLVVESFPPGARVFLDGSPLPGVTPIVLDDVDARREYGLRMDLDDHALWEGSSPADGATVQRVRVELVRRFGPMSVTSTPPGAAVFINDEPVGRTPLLLDRVDLLGPTALSLKRNGFESYDEVLRNLEPSQEVHRELTRQQRR